ncbi:HECTD2 (predicted) [Pycnogonum litorale]
MSINGNSVTCPSCKITLTLSHGQSRTVCPYCGSFYNSAVNNDIRERTGRTENNFSPHLPPIEAHRQASDERTRRRSDDIVPGTTRFGRIITNGIGIVHASLTYLVMPRGNDAQTQPEASGAPAQTANMSSLPPIESKSASKTRRSKERNKSVSRKDSTTEDRLSKSLDTESFRAEKRSSSEPGGRRRSCHSSKSASSSLASRVGSGTITIKYPECTMTWQSIKDDILKARNTRDYRKVKEIYETVFNSLVNLNATFKFEPDQDGAHIEDPNLKLEFLNNIYDALAELPSHITKATLKALISCLLTMQNCQLLGKDETRGIFMLLQCPVFSNQSSYTVLGHLLRHISSYQPTDHKLLIYWFKLIDADRLRQIVRRLLQFITIRQFSVAGSQSDTNKTKLWIPAATKVLALLNASNNMCRPQKIDYSEFYNSALDHIDLMGEYYSWQNPARCNRHDR